MEELVNQRKQDLLKIENVMREINLIAKDIAVETHKQSDKIMAVD